MLSEDLEKYPGARCVHYCKRIDKLTNKQRAYLLADIVVYFIKKDEEKFIKMLEESEHVKSQL